MTTKILNQQVYKQIFTPMLLCSKGVIQLTFAYMYLYQTDV